MNKFMSIAVKEAQAGVKYNHGGPFGAVITKNGEIIAKAHNKVITSNDPTAHAEIIAIRMAAKKLNSFDLSDCEIYSSCEPCPMCLAAIHWAKIKKLYYGCTREDAAVIGFEDQHLYEILQGKTKPQMEIEQLDRNECLQPFAAWDVKPDKVQY
jgi:guanine deaminase